MVSHKAWTRAESRRELAQASDSGHMLAAETGAVVGIRLLGTV